MAATKVEKFDTVDDAIVGAGTSVLSHLGTGMADIQTVDEVKAYEEENNLTGPPVEGAHRAYAGPYTDMEDGRNAWTASQDSGDLSRTKNAIPPPPAEVKTGTRSPSKETPREPARETRPETTQKK